MPAPTTVDEFLDLIRKSAVLEEARLAGYVRKLKAAPNTPKELNAYAGLFVRDGYLTYFQAEQFLQGRWKRFTIGKYKVLERIGAGGMGQVFLCEHKLMRRRVAVKVLPTAKASDPSALERFYREARAVAALDHPNIVRAYDIDQDDNLHFLVMEYVDGSSLQDIVRKTGPMDVTRACHYIYWSAIGLQNAHEGGLIHRDIKPGNILVDRQGVVKILDLGLARFFNDDEDALTRKYDENVLGTADYLAPEQAIDSHTVDGRADIYSLGATFYYMLGGSPPFTEGSVAQKLLWHQTRMPKSIRDLRPEVPQTLARVIEKMMAKKAEDRYQTPALLAEALLPLTQTPIPPPPDDEMPQLSAAAMGPGSATATVSSSPRTMVIAPRTPAPGTKTSVAVAEPDAETRRTAAAPVVEPIAEHLNGVPNWEAIGEATTANAGHADTARTNKAGRSGKGKAGVGRATDIASPAAIRKPPSSRRYIALASVAGVVALCAVAFAVYWFVLRGPKPKTVPPSADLPRTLVLSKTPGDLHFTAFKDAAAASRPGDRIVVQDDEWEEVVTLSGIKGLTLTAAEGKRVVWRVPAKTNPMAILSLHNAENVRIAGISFQAGGRAENVLRLTGSQSSGLVLEEVELSGATGSIVAFHQCGGDKARPVTVRNSRFTSVAGVDCKAAIAFTADPQTKPNLPPPTNRDILVADCRIEGPFTAAAFVFEGSAQSVTVQECRIWKAADGVLFRPPGAGVSWQVDITSNTVHTLSGAGIRCENVVLMKKPTNKIAVAQNFFANVGTVARADGDMAGAAFVTAVGNFRKRGTPEGTLTLFAAIEIDADVPVDPASKMFLRYGKDHALFKAYQGKPVGAPPE